MASEHPRDPDPMVPLQDGDFHRIPGIGPGIQQRLHAAGINTFDHLASLTPDEICVMLNGLVGMTSERISHQDWPGKARLLAQVLREEQSALEPEEAGERQHYASFMIELLQDEEQSVRRTRVVNVKAGSKDSWAGWDSRRLLEWLQQQAGIAPASAAPIEPTAHIEAAHIEPVAQTELADQLEAEHIEPEADETPSIGEMPRVRMPGPAEVLSASVIDPASQQPSRFIYTGSPAALHLALDMRKTALAPGTPLTYQVMVEAREVGTSERVRLAEAHGQHNVEEVVQLNIPLQAITEGTYRLSVSAQLSPVDDRKQPERDRLQVFTEGGIIHVFSEAPATAG